MYYMVKIFYGISILGLSGYAMDKQMRHWGLKYESREKRLYVQTESIELELFGFIVHYKRVGLF